MKPAVFRFRRIIHISDKYHNVCLLPEAGGCPVSCSDFGFRLSVFRHSILSGHTGVMCRPDVPIIILFPSGRNPASRGPAGGLSENLHRVDFSRSPESRADSMSAAAAGRSWASDGLQTHGARALPQPDSCIHKFTISSNKWQILFTNPRYSLGVTRKARGASRRARASGQKPGLRLFGNLFT